MLAHTGSDEWIVKISKLLQTHRSHSNSLKLVIIEVYTLEKLAYVTYGPLLPQTYPPMPLITAFNSLPGLTCGTCKLIPALSNFHSGTVSFHHF